MDGAKTEVGADTGKTETKPGGGGKPAAGGPGAGPGQMSASQRAALSKELDQLDMATIGALAGQGPATAGVLRGGDVPTGALEQMAASGSGVSSSGGSGLNLGPGGGGGKLMPGQTGGGLSAIGNTTASTASSAGAATTVKGPTGNVSASASVSGGAVNNASKVVAGMRAGFRACYNRGLAANPEMSGSVRVTARIGPNGEVQSANASPSGSISGDVASCIASRVRSAQFDPPEGGSSTIVIPVTLVQQK
jgi:hypothetical protein